MNYGGDGFEGKYEGKYEWAEMDYDGGIMVVMIMMRM